MLSTTTLARASRASLLQLQRRSLASPAVRRTFQTSAPRAAAPETPAVVVPVRRPVGAFRGGLFGFLLGSTLAGAGVYYYILEEYRVSNELLTEDIYALQGAVQRIEAYTRGLEEKWVAMQKK